VTISVVMVTKNEELAIEAVIKEIKTFVPEANILIVDSSKDRTPEIAQGLGAEVIRQYPPRGYGWAIDLALKSAKSDIVVTLDCDHTYPPGAIPQMIQYIKDGYEFVDGSRLMSSRPKNMPLPNYIANMTFVYCARILFNLPVNDLHSGMRAYRRSILDTLNWDPSGPALPVELLIKPILMGYRCKIMGIQYRSRIGYTTLDRIHSTYWTYKRLFRLKYWQIFTKKFNNPKGEISIDSSIYG